MQESSAPPVEPGPGHDDERPLKPHLALTAGFLMGAADSVPGVSGGTIALILGVYERFITAISRVLKAPRLVRDPEGRRRLAGAFRLLVPLGVGLLVAYYLGVHILVGDEDTDGLLLAENTAPLCYAFFFGLVVASLREPWGRIATHRPAHLLAAALTAAAAFTLAILPHARGQVADWQFLYGGALAVTVMLLPGVSGSLVLLMLGQYQLIGKAVTTRNVPPLLWLGAGIVLGLALTVPLLRRLLRAHHDTTMAALTGLMVGSLGALWPWKSGYDPKEGALTPEGVGEGWPLVLVAAALGAAAAWGLARLERRMRPGDQPAG